jgi:phosphohistidine swiveling domain-containing protein
MPNPMPDRLMPGQPMPIPSDFPVQWEQPAQARRLWVLDRQHFGRPLSPLAADVCCRRATAGINRAMERYQLPVRLEMLAINGYLYNCYQPVAIPPDLVLKALNALGRVAPRLFQAIRRKVASGMAAKYMPHVAPVIANLQMLWEHEWLPEIREHLAFWHAFDLCGASESALADHLDESLRRIERLWELHFLIVMPAFIAASQFEDAHRQLFEANSSGGALISHRLLQAADTSFLQADRALWQLSRQLRTLPAARATLERLPAAEVLPALSDCAEGQIFVAELRAWLNRYGLRGHGSDGLNDASWIEDSLPAIQHLQAFVQQPDRDLAAELRVQAAERDAAVAQVRQRLSLQPPIVRERYMSALQAAQSATFLSTEHNFWIDQQAMFCLRRVFLEIGRRYAAIARLAAAEDIFLLTLDEVHRLPRGVPAPDQHALAARRARLDHARSLSPPGFLGSIPLMAPPPEDPFVRSILRVLGDAALGPVSRSVPSALIQLQGQAASVGVVRGRARILRSLNDGGRLQSGDILVAEATMPAWTPLFAIAAAVVTDVGGVLSHAATTAREYGIPAVVGVSNATAAIRDGELVEVDGGKGSVRVVGIAE